jgi:rRNA maturation RNase YbeY
MPVSFHFQSAITLNERTRLKLFLEQLARKEAGKSVSLNYVFCSDDDLLEINRQYLQHDFYTDIITFDLSDSATKLIQSDIFISTDRVKDNARNLGIAQNLELHRVIFHGLLHLCGYKDKSAADQKRMRSREDFYLKKYRLL